MSDYTPTTHEVREAWLNAEYEERDVATSDDDLRAEFDSWLAAHDAEVRASVVAEEPEWEYECDRVAAGFGGRIRIADPEEHRKQCSGRIYRRRKAGLWVPVEQDQTTNHEIRRQP